MKFFKNSSMRIKCAFILVFMGYLACHVETKEMPNKKGPAFGDTNNIFNKKGPAGPQYDFISGIHPGTKESQNVANGLSRLASLRDAEAETPEVNTTSGLLLGVSYLDSHAFYSVPYAEPPIADLRFKAPIAMASNSMATINASFPNQLACQQVPRNCTNGVCLTEDLLSEDCLVLNIFVPSSKDLEQADGLTDELLPVMVFFHGGFFFSGSGTAPAYSGIGLSNKTNTVVVTVNYRLGPFGFLYYHDANNETIEGNQGLKDQQLALQWVQDNIENFGGNTSEVTIFGESSGAQATLFHLIANTSSSYYARAILQSTPAGFPYQTKEDASLVTEAVMDAVNCTNHTIECLRNTSAGVLADSLQQVILKAGLRQEPFDAIEPFRPVIDEVLITEQPLTSIEEDSWNKDKDVMLGVNAEELVYFQYLNITQSYFMEINNFLLGSDSAVVVEKYEELAKGTSYEGNYPAMLAVESTDMFFVCPTRSLANLISQSSVSGSVYLYNNTYPMGGINCKDVLAFDEACGHAFHSAELVYIFRSGLEYGYNFTENDTKVADMFSEYWGNFAKFGDPSPDRTSEDYTEWPLYQNDVQEGLPNLIIKFPPSEVSFDFRNEVCDFWDSLNDGNNATDGSTTESMGSGSGTEPPSVMESTTDGSVTRSLNLHLLLLSAVISILLGFL